MIGILNKTILHFLSQKLFREDFRSGAIARRQENHPSHPTTRHPPHPLACKKKRDRERMRETDVAGFLRRGGGFK